MTTYEDLKTMTATTDAYPSKEGYIVSFYSGLPIDATWDQGVTWQREHVWCTSHSWWGSAPSSNTKNAATDLHHLRPEISSINNARSNNVFGEISDRDSYAQTYEDTIWGYIHSSVFEPLDSVKGDVARILMYLLVRYKSETSSCPITNIVHTSEGTTSSAYELLLKWHNEDPVSSFEITRNEETFKIQGNRNPFIDIPNYANLIWG